MGWMQKLNEVYDAVIATSPDEGSNQIVLVPAGFIQKPIKYQISISKESTFISARELPEEERMCIVPSTPEAESRTGDNGTPFPLAEQLKYLICENIENPRLERYLEQLNEWSLSDGAPYSLKVLNIYLKKKTLIQDLKSWPGINYREGKDDKSFVCFAILDDIDSDVALWKRKDIQDSWIRFSNSKRDGQKALCYVSGETRVILDNHPKFLGNPKLITAKDTEYPFQYKGRFVEDRSAATVSNVSSIRGHNALKWLLDKQGFKKFGLNIVAWNVSQGSLSAPIEDDEEYDETENYPDTFKEYGDTLRKAVDGNGSALKSFCGKVGECAERDNRVSQTVILGMEAATDGRMSINYYQELDSNTYANKILQWYETCCWEYVWKDGKRVIKTPFPSQIACAVMGADAVQRAKNDLQNKKSDSKLMRDLYKRLLCCIVDGKAFPRNLLNSAIHRAEFPLSFKDSNGSWQRTKWETCLRTVCALIRRNRFDEKKTMPQAKMDVYCTDRSYLYGRLLALADHLEKEANKENSGIPTNAIRLLQRFVQSPASTWLELHMKLLPYLQQIGSINHFSDFYQRMIGEVELLFSNEDRQDNHPLTELFLLGFYAQTRELYLPATEKESTLSEKRDYTPTNRKSELFGCLLAVGDCIEWRAEKKEENQYSEHDGRTLALRYMSQFERKPVDTWEQIHGKLIPYMEKLGIAKSGFYLSMLHEIETQFEMADRFNNCPLDRSFLSGYYCMRQCIRKENVNLNIDHISADSIKMTREYVFGKLLAIENRIERTVLFLEKSEEENRTSNAIRLFSNYQRKPYSTWLYLTQKMKPYMKKLESIRSHQAQRFKKEIEILTEQLENNEWNKDIPLEAGWLYCFYSNYYVKGEDENGNFK